MADGVGDHGCDQFHSFLHGVVHFGGGLRTNPGDESEATKGVEPGDADADSRKVVPDELADLRDRCRVGLTASQSADFPLLIHHDEDDKPANIRRGEAEKGFVILGADVLKVATGSRQFFDRVNDVFGAFRRIHIDRSGFSMGGLFAELCGPLGGGADVWEFGGEVGEDAGADFQTLVEDPDGVLTHFLAGEEFRDGIPKIQTRLDTAAPEGLTKIVVREQQAAFGMDRCRTVIQKPCGGTKGIGRASFFL